MQSKQARWGPTARHRRCCGSRGGAAYPCAARSGWCRPFSPAPGPGSCRPPPESASFRTARARPCLLGLQASGLADPQTHLLRLQRLETPPRRKSAATAVPAREADAQPDAASEDDGFQLTPEFTQPDEQQQERQPECPPSPANVAAPAEAAAAAEVVLQGPADGPPPGLGLPTTQFRSYFSGFTRVRATTPFSSAAAHGGEHVTGGTRWCGVQLVLVSC